VFQILRRATDFKTNAKDLWSLLTYFAYNPIFRVELRKKHEMMLGYRGLERDSQESCRRATAEIPNEPCAAGLSVSLRSSSARLETHQTGKGL
jgi:hypothetical protein